LEKITDLYDFAPVGYFSIDESGVVLDANLKSAALLGVERSRLINRSLLLFVDQKSRPILLSFLKNVLAEPKDQECEALLLKKGGGTFWAVFRATSAVCSAGSRRWCRVAFGDVTARKQAEEAQRRLEDLADTNLGLNREIVRRQPSSKTSRKANRAKAGC